MATTDPPPTTDERRGLLTNREREILAGTADVSDNYHFAVLSRVRRKITEVGTDAALLREHHPELFRNLRTAVCDGGDEG